MTSGGGAMRVADERFPTCCRWAPGRSLWMESVMAPLWMAVHDAYKPSLTIHFWPSRILSHFVLQEFLGYFLVPVSFSKQRMNFPHFLPTFLPTEMWGYEGYLLLSPSWLLERAIMIWGPHRLPQSIVCCKYLDKTRYPAKNSFNKSPIKGLLNTIITPNYPPTRSYFLGMGSIGRDYP